MLPPISMDARFCPTGELEGVGDEVDPDLPEQVRIARRRRQVADLALDDPPRLRLGQFVVGPAHQLVHLDLARL